MSDLTELMNYTYNLCEDGNYDDAIEYFDAILQKDPRNIRIIIDKGVTLLNLKRYDDAIECFNNSLQLDPVNVDALMNSELALVFTYKGLSLGELGLLEDAIQQFDKALLIDEKLDLAINNRKTAFELLKRNKNSE